MIDRIIDSFKKLEGSYTSVIEAEKILKILLTFMVIDKVFEYEVQENGVMLKNDADKFGIYLKEQLDLYVENEQVKLFLFSSLVMLYFFLNKQIMDNDYFGLIFEANDELAQKMRNMLKPELVECFRITELFFQDKPVEEVVK